VLDLPGRVKNASGLFNLMRDLGGAVGLAALNTALNDRTDLHIVRLHEAVGWSRGAAVEMLNTMTARLQSFGSDAQAMALKQLTQFVHQQATTMAFADVFFVLTVVFVVLAATGFVMKRPVPMAAGGGH
jgi:DHA2 family multidrug resistance protein